MTLLTEAEARTYITSPLVSAAFARLLTAAEDAITDAIGPVGNVTEVITAGAGDLVMLSRRASAVVSVVEQDVTLAANDYVLHGSGRMLHRLDTGTNGDSRWRGRLLITYTPVSDVERRKIAQVELMKLEIDFNPGVTSERIGDWTETTSSPSQEYLDSRAAILASLQSTFVLI